MIPVYTHVTYMKITAEKYPIAVATIAAPAFARIPFREVKGHILVIQTDVHHNPIQTSTHASWCSRKMFRKIFKDDMRRHPERFVQL